MRRLAIAYVVALHLVTWLTQGIGFTSDAAGYLDGIESLATGRAAYFPPGYSLFLAPFAAISPAAMGDAVAAAQHVLMIVTLLALSQLMRPVVGRTLAAWSLIIAGSAAPTLFLPQMILAENVALAAMTGTLWLAARPSSLRMGVIDLLAGVCLGVAGRARVVPLVAMSVPIVCVQLVPAQWRRSLVRSLGVGAVGAALVLAVMVWTYSQTVRFALTTGQGLHLYNRVVTQQGLVDDDGPATRRLMDVLAGAPLRVPHWTVGGLLYERGQSSAEIERLLGDVAREGMRTDRWGFVRYSFAQAWRQYHTPPVLWTTPVAPTPVPRLERRLPALLPPLGWYWWRFFTAGFAMVWPLLMWAPLLGLLLLPFIRERRIFVALLAVPALYLLVSAQLDLFSPRLSSAVVPFALVLVPAPLAALLRAIGRPPQD